VLASIFATPLNLEATTAALGVVIGLAAQGIGGAVIGGVWGWLLAAVAASISEPFLERAYSRIEIDAVTWILSGISASAFGLATTWLVEGSTQKRTSVARYINVTIVGIAILSSCYVATCTVIALIASDQNFLNRITRRAPSIANTISAISELFNIDFTASTPTIFVRTAILAWLILATTFVMRGVYILSESGRLFRRGWHSSRSRWFSRWFAIWVVLNCGTSACLTVWALRDPLTRSHFSIMLSNIKISVHLWDSKFAGYTLAVGSCSIRSPSLPYISSYDSPFPRKVIFLLKDVWIPMVWRRRNITGTQIVMTSFGIEGFMLDSDIGMQIPNTLSVRHFSDWDT